MFEIILSILGLCMLAYAGLLISKRRRVRFTRFFIWAGLALTVYGALAVRFAEKMPSALLWTVRIVLALLFLSFIFVEGLLVCAAHQKPKKQVEVLIVLGAGLFGDRLSLSLKRRLDLALRIGSQAPDVIYVVCGGQGPDEWISEAKAMHDYLVQAGMKEERIFQEDQSTSTYENLHYAIQRFHLKNNAVGVVTNSFHLCRAVRMARKLGLDAYGFGTPSPHLTSLAFYTREYFAFMKAVLKRQI